MADRKEKLQQLIEKYQSFKQQGRLDLSVCQEIIFTFKLVLLSFFCLKKRFK